jgi:hypothetical protein
MKKRIEAKRARLRAKADKIIDEYIAWEASHPRPDLKQIEDIALRLRKEWGRAKESIVSIEIVSLFSCLPIDRTLACSDPVFS